MKKQDLFLDIDQMAEKWPSNIIARKKVGEFTGHIVTGKTVANYEAKGEGPDGKIKFGRNAGYIKAPFVAWLKKHIALVEQRAAER